MLLAMQRPAPSQSSSSLSSFAGLLATLASPAPSAAPDVDDDAPLWNTSDLEKTWLLSATNAHCARMDVTGRQIANWIEIRIEGMDH